MSVLDSIQSRFSPYAFDGMPVALEDIRSAFEAARWAASAYNTQPWRFLYATRGSSEFQQLLRYPVAFNREWLIHAGGIAVVLARTQSEYNGETDSQAEYCTGLAVGQFTIQLTSLGYQMHQLAGFDAVQLHREMQLPDFLKPITMIGIGRQAKAGQDLEKWIEMDNNRQQRTRKPLEDLVIKPGKSFSA